MPGHLPFSDRGVTSGIYRIESITAGDGHGLDTNLSGDYLLRGA